MFDDRINELRSIKFCFFITEENNKVGLYTDNFDDFSFAEIKDEREEFLDSSNITCKHLQDKVKGPSIISAYNKLETEKRRTAVITC